MVRYHESNPFDKYKKDGILISVNSPEPKSYTIVHKNNLKVIVLLPLVALLVTQNALLCLSFGYFDFDYNSGFFGFANPFQSVIHHPSNPLNQPHKRYVNDQIQSLASSRDSLDAHIRQILVPRVSGTPGNIKVRQYIVDSLKSNGYQIELDEFTGSTPVGRVKFANIIGSSNPNACRQLVLACHYDSKMMEGFLGATDSAVPCAMLLTISETAGKSFIKNNGQNNDDSKNSLGLKFIFFDGEEAFHQWTSKDSLYGSRHLAAKWERQPLPRQCLSKHNSPFPSSELSKIELFVLLDLIGASDSAFVSYNRQVRSHYDSMKRHERTYLERSGLNKQQVYEASAFKSSFVPLDLVEDDHVPFKQRGVPILSLLSNPFPKVWHTIDDNYDAIDFDRTRRILHVLEKFVENYS